MLYLAIIFTSSSGAHRRFSTKRKIFRHTVTYQKPRGGGEGGHRAQEISEKWS